MLTSLLRDKYEEKFERIPIGSHRVATQPTMRPEVVLKEVLDMLEQVFRVPHRYLLPGADGHPGHAPGIVPQQFRASQVTDGDRLGRRSTSCKSSLRASPIRRPVTHSKPSRVV